MGAQSRKMKVSLVIREKRVSNNIDSFRRTKCDAKKGCK